MQCVVLAGGLATRMRPITDSLPKNLIPVFGVPFADYQLSWLHAHGVDRVVYAIGHLGGQIRDFVGDGRRWHLEVSYVDDGEQLRGTGGALRLALGQSRLEESFLVTWGDAFLPIDFELVWRRFLAVEEPALMTVFHNRGRWGRSNVRYAAGKVSLYENNAAPERAAEMEFIDYGLLALRRDVVAARVPPGRVFDLGDLCHALSLEGSLAGFEVSERFYEIGSLDGLHDFERWVEAHGR